MHVLNGSATENCSLALSRHTFYRCRDNDSMATW